MKNFFLSLGWGLKTVVRMAFLFGFFWLVVWALNIGMFIVQVKGFLVGLLIEFSSGWFIDVISVIDWIITGAVAILIIGLFMFFVGRFIESQFFLRRPYTIKDIIPYAIVMLIVYVICYPGLHSIVPESLLGYLDMVRNELYFSKMVWVPLEDGTYFAYLVMGTLAGSGFLIWSALNEFE